MKKVFSFLPVVLFTSTLISAAPIVQFEEDGRASDCVRWARGETFLVAAAHGDHPNDDPAYMEFYMELYTNCLEG